MTPQTRRNETAALRRTARFAITAAAAAFWAAAAWNAWSLAGEARRLQGFKAQPVVPDRARSAALEERYEELAARLRQRSEWLAELERWRTGRMPWARVLSEAREAVPPGVRLDTVRAACRIEQDLGDQDGVTAWKVCTLRLGGVTEPEALLRYLDQVGRQPSWAAHWAPPRMGNLAPDRAHPGQRLFALETESERTPWP